MIAANHAGTVGEVYVDGFFPRAMLERSNTEFESRAVAFSVIKFNVSWKFCTFTLSSVSYIECHRAATLQKAPPDKKAYGRSIRRGDSADISGFVTRIGELRP